MPEDKKEAEETHAYTPGLKIKNVWLVQKERRLPIMGSVLVNKDDVVKEDKIVAETLVRTLNIINKVDLSTHRLRKPNRHQIV